MKSSILDTICSPQDVKELPFEQLDVLCTQIRECGTSGISAIRTSC